MQGCDASILLDSTPTNKAEKDSPINNPSLRGYDVIDAAKAAVEAACPCTVSCADIIAFAARDCSSLAGQIHYPVPSGRRDGRVSLESDTFRNLPPPTLNADQLVAFFAKKGLTADEMVTLSGGHSIGVTHCSSFAGNRLYNFSMVEAETTDPSIDPKFAGFLKRSCPRETARSGDPATVALDVATPTKLDNGYYRNLVKGRGVLASDQTLWTSPATAGMVAADAGNGEAWKAKFAAAMVRMGEIGVLTGSQGEIRESCRVVN